MPAMSSKLRPLTPLIAEILCCLHGVLSCCFTSVVIMWVPSHVRLVGNSVADNASNAALLLPVSNLTVSHLDYKSLKH